MRTGVGGGRATLMKVLYTEERMPKVDGVGGGKRHGSSPGGTSARASSGCSFFAPPPPPLGLDGGGRRRLPRSLGSGSPKHDAWQQGEGVAGKEPEEGDTPPHGGVGGVTRSRGAAPSNGHSSADCGGTAAAGGDRGARKASSASSSSRAGGRRKPARLRSESPGTCECCGLGTCVPCAVGGVGGVVGWAAAAAARAWASHAGTSASMWRVATRLMRLRFGFDDLGLAGTMT
mmetsp:Transcript_138779/g.442631  ORF Transcript_138779/g.442631 Transcript_138779/m.442631 type:complete len:232 (+) Transcript_138779:268-963(+)